MSKDESKQGGGQTPEDEKAKGGYKNYLNYLKDNKNSKISVWIGKASEIYGEIKNYSPGADNEIHGGIIAPDEAISHGILGKAVEIARLEWVKAKLESEDPVDLSMQYNTRMARLNDEYHHKNILFPDVSIVGFMKDKDSDLDRLLVTKDQEDCLNQVFAVDPTSGVVLEVFDVTTKSCLVALRRSGSV